jgi:hypothetical protein
LKRGGITPTIWYGLYELDRAADHVGIAHKIALPEMMSQHNDGLRRLSRRRIRRNQPASHLRADAPMIRRIGVNVHGLHVFREIAVRSGQVPPIHQRDVFDRFHLAKLVCLLGVRASKTVRAGFVHEPQLHDAVGARVGKGIDEHRVNDAKDGARRSNAERQREHCCQGEAWAFAKLAGGIAQVSE